MAVQGVNLTTPLRLPPLCLRVEMIEPRIALRLEGFTLEPGEVWAIAIGAKDQVDAPVALILPEEGVDVLPDNLALLGDLEEPALHPLTNERVAIGQPLRAADKEAEKLPRGPRLVFPDDGVRFRIHLDDARLRARPGPHGMEAIVEDENVSIREGIGVMLMTQLVLAPFPAEVTTLLVDDGHRVQQSKAGEHIAIGQDLAGIGMRPLLASVERTDGIGVGVEMLVGVPLPDHFFIRCDLMEVIAPDAALVFGPRRAAFDAPGQFCRNRLPTQHHGVAIGHATEIMMQGVLRILPQNVPIPIHFHDGAAPAAEGDRPLAGLAADQEMAVIEEIAVVAGTIWQLPAVDDGALHIDQVG